MNRILVQVQSPDRRVAESVSNPIPPNSAIQTSSRRRQLQLRAGRTPAKILASFL